MRAALALLLLVATGCPASSESSATEPNRTPPPAATAPTPLPVPEDEPAPVAALAPGIAPRTVTLPDTTVSFELVAVTLPRSDVDGAARTLWVARTETTWDAYDVYVYGLDEHAPADDGADALVRPSQPYVLADYGYGHAGFPVICVSAVGAEGYCAWLSARTGRRFRLPTEAEWDALCAGGAGGRGGADADATADAAEPTDAAWVRENAERRTHAVGTSAPDALGLHDLLGNVTEWCRAADGGHVARGGCFLDRGKDVDCDARRVPDASWNATDPQIPKSRWWLADANFAGFRVVCDDAP